MKKTEFHKTIKKENRKYNLVKNMAFLRMKLSIGKKRKQYEEAYDFYTYKYDFDKRNNALPEKLYYKPTDVIIYELIRKENLSKTKAGLIQLVKKYYSHKFLNGGLLSRRVDEVVNGIDQSLHSGNSWYSTCVFDFANDEELDSYIHHFELFFHNFSSSYAAIEIHITLSEEYANELSQFIKEQYKKPGMCIHRDWGRNKRKNGAKMSYGISSGISSEEAKCQIIYEQIQYIKRRFLQVIGKYIPLMIYSFNKNVISINIFETNITPAMDLEYSIHYGLGLDEMKGFFFSSYARLYTCTAIVNKRYDDRSDMIYVYNPEKMDDYGMFYSLHNQMIEEFTKDYFKNLYRIVVLKDLGHAYLSKIISYRNQVNKCKTDRKNNKALLRIQYQINKDFYDFRKISEELPVNQEMKNAEEILSQNEWARKSIYFVYHTYSQFFEYPKSIWEQVNNNFLEVESDLVRKLEVSESLSKYTSERKSMILILIQVLLALLTFFLLVFPDIVPHIASFLKGIWLFVFRNS